MNTAVLGLDMMLGEMERKLDAAQGTVGAEEKERLETLSDISMACTTAVDILNDLLSFEKVPFQPEPSRSPLAPHSPPSRLHPHPHPHPHPHSHPHTLPHPHLDDRLSFRWRAASSSCTPRPYRPCPS